MPTSRAVIPTFNMAIGFDVASTYFTPIWTRFLIAPLSLSFHRASPRLGRCAKHNSKTGFPGLEAQHPKAYPAHISILLDVFPAEALSITEKPQGLTPLYGLIQDFETEFVDDDSGTYWHKR